MMDGMLEALVGRTLSGLRVGKWFLVNICRLGICGLLLRLLLRCWLLLPLLVARLSIGLILSRLSVYGRLEGRVGIAWLSLDRRLLRWPTEPMAMREGVL